MCAPPSSIPRSSPPISSVLLLLAVSALIPGCGAPRTLTGRWAPVSLPSAADLEAALDARRGAVHSLRALARLRYRDADASGAARQAIIVARPDRVRVEVLSVFGAVFVLTAEDGAMTAYARDEDTVYRGQASLENLQRYARLFMPVRDLVDFVLGTPPPRPARQERVSFDAEAGGIRLWRALDDGAQIVWFNDATLPVAAEERRSDGRALWHATFTRYEDHGGIPLATQLGLDLPVSERSIDIRLEDVDVNPALDASIFAFQAPPGSKVVNLDHVAD
jgi:hypothetical protein